MEFGGVFSLIKSLNDANPLDVQLEPKRLTEYFLDSCAFSKSPDQANPGRFSRENPCLVAMKQATLQEVQKVEREANKSFDSLFSSLDSIMQVRKQLEEEAQVVADEGRADVPHDASADQEHRMIVTSETCLSKPLNSEVKM